MPTVGWDGAGVNATVTTTPQEADTNNNAAGATVRLFILLLWLLLPSPQYCCYYYYDNRLFLSTLLECPTDCVTPPAESMKNGGGSDL